MRWSVLFNPISSRLSQERQNTDLVIGLPHVIVQTKYTFELPPRHPYEIEGIAQPKRGLSETDQSISFSH